MVDKANYDWSSLLYDLTANLPAALSPMKLGQDVRNYYDTGSFVDPSMQAQQSTVDWLQREAPKYLQGKQLPPLTDYSIWTGSTPNQANIDAMLEAVMAAKKAEVNAPQKVAQRGGYDMAFQEGPRVATPTEAAAAFLAKQSNAQDVYAARGNDIVRASGQGLNTQLYPMSPVTNSTLTPADAEAQAKAAAIRQAAAADAARQRITEALLGSSAVAPMPRPIQGQVYDPTAQATAYNQAQLQALYQQLAPLIQAESRGRYIPQAGQDALNNLQKQTEAAIWHAKNRARGTLS